MRKWKELTKEEKKELIIKGVIFAAGVGLGIGGSYAVRKAGTKRNMRKYDQGVIRMDTARVGTKGEQFWLGVGNPAKNGGKPHYDKEFVFDNHHDALTLFQELAADATKYISETDSDLFNEVLTETLEAAEKGKK